MGRGCVRLDKFHWYTISTYFLGSPRGLGVETVFDVPSFAHEITAHC
jgi:hypothetical protein